MNAQRGIRAAAATAACALALSLIGMPPSHAGAGDWTNVSGIPSGSNYPEIATGAVPSLKLFGDELQVAWTQTNSSDSGGINVAALNRNGDLVRASSAAVTGGRFNGFPQLLSYQGQRALSFGGYPAGTGAGSRGQNLATSADGVTWTLNPGSLSATNQADVSSGGGTVEAQSPGPNTLIWAGAPNMGSVTWHVGLASTNPAQDPDGRYDPPSGQLVNSVNVVYEASTNKTFAAFYNPEAGTFFGEIAPSYSGFSLVPGSAIRSSSGLASRVPMAARASGVFVAFADPASPSSSSRDLIIREMNSGRTWTIPNSAGAEEVAMDAAPNGRVWVTYELGGEMFIVHTDPNARDFGAPKKWGTPERGVTIYQSGIEGDRSAAYIGVNTFASGEQNIYVTPVLPNLTIRRVKSTAGSITVKITDGGAPVRNAEVTAFKKTLKSGKGGLLRIDLPGGARAVKVSATGPGYTTTTATIRR